MKIFLTVVTVLSSILMIIVILLQQGKGADLGSAFGGGARGGLFTTTGKANFLTRTTSALVVIFLTSCLALALYLGESRQDSISQELQSTGSSSESTQSEQSVPSAESNTEDQSKNIPE